jgi:4'-phosphopantetheinyl transferase
VIPPQGVCELWVAAAPAAFDPDRRRLDALLTPAERAHADRQRREVDRRRLRRSRALLRLLLAGYLDQDPAAIQVDRGCPSCDRPHGRPRLAGVHPLQFSVAHAAGLLVFAFQAGTPVGVDAEPAAGHGPEPPPELVELALTPAERRHLALARARDRWRWFLRCWTRKEAVLKLAGTGLSVPLQDVVVDPSGPGGPVDLRVEGWTGTAVWAGDLDLGPDFVGAVASAGPAPDLRVAELRPAELRAAAG